MTNPDAGASLFCPSCAALREARDKDKWRESFLWRASVERD